MGELEAELRRLAQWQDAVSRAADKRTVELAGYNQSLAYTHAADLARDHEAKRGDGWVREYGKRLRAEKPVAEGE